MTLLFSSAFRSPISALMRLVAMVATCLWTLTACVAEDLPAYKAELVVEGWIEDEGYPVVLLTETVPVTSVSQSADDLEDRLLRWAVVRISDGTYTVTLTGRYDRGYFPPYIYTTSRMKGRAGRTYTLSVEVDERQATATTTIPARPQVSDWRIEALPDCDTLFTVKALINDPADDKNYYQLFARTGKEARQFLPSLMGSIDDDVMDGATWVSIYRGQKLGSGRYTPYFRPGDTLAVKVAQVDAEAFRFWDDYSQLLTEGNNILLAPQQNVRGNICGGLGCWYGLSAVTRYAICTRVPILFSPGQGEDAMDNGAEWAAEGQFPGRVYGAGHNN